MDRGLSLGVSPPSHREDVHFHCAGLSLHSASTTWSFAELGFLCLASASRRAEAVSARSNPSHGTRDVRRVCDLLGSVSLPELVRKDFSQVLRGGPFVFFTDKPPRVFMGQQGGWRLWTSLSHCSEATLDTDKCWPWETEPVAPFRWA